MGLPAPFSRTKRRGETIWEDALGLALVLEKALNERLKRERDRRRDDSDRGASESEPPADERPVPMAVLVLAPQYSSDLKQGERCWLSTLRDMERGDRAVVYQTREGQGIVAIFDVVDDYTEWDDTWGWGADGRIHLLTKPLLRRELVRDPDLRRVFERPQGRRYLPPKAQSALVTLLKTRMPDGELPRVRLE